MKACKLFPIAWYVHVFIRYGGANKSRSDAVCQAF